LHLLCSVLHCSGGNVGAARCGTIDSDRVCAHVQCSDAVRTTASQGHWRHFQQPLGAHSGSAVPDSDTLSVT
jgi:hypothetical protein